MGQDGRTASPIVRHKLRHFYRIKSDGSCERIALDKHEVHRQYAVAVRDLRVLDFDPLLPTSCALAPARDSGIPCTLKNKRSAPVPASGIMSCAAQAQFCSTWTPSACSSPPMTRSSPFRTRTRRWLTNSRASCRRGCAAPPASKSLGRRSAWSMGPMLTPAGTHARHATLLQLADGAAGADSHRAGAGSARTAAGSGPPPTWRSTVKAR